MNKSQKFLLNLQKSDQANKGCVDCNSMATFVDLKYGSFVCTRCAGLHRELGTDYCVIRSISLDNISDEHLKIFKFTKGNTFVNLEYEAIDKNIMMSYKPSPDSTEKVAREFIRKKYKVKQFYKKYLQPSPIVIKNETIVTKPQVVEKDMLHFDEPIKHETQQPFQQQSFTEIQQQQFSQFQQQQFQQLHATQEAEYNKKQEEINYKNKVNNIMNMFHY
jgi:hypothetical protein